MAPFLSLWAVKVLPKHCMSVCGTGNVRDVRLASVPLQTV